MSADKSRAAVFAGWIKDRLPLHQHDRDAIAAELRRLDESEAALLAALEVAHVRCTSKDHDRFAALIAKTKEARNAR